MTIELILSGISVGVTLANTAVVALMYIRYIKQARGMFYMLRAERDGEIEIVDPLSILR